MNKKFKNIYFKLKLLHYNNLNVFTVISDQLNMSFLEIKKNNNLH